MQKTDLEEGDYVEYKYYNPLDQTTCKKRGYIVVFRKYGSEDIAWIGPEKKITGGMKSIFLPDILRKVPPPQV